MKASPVLILASLLVLSAAIQPAAAQKASDRCEPYLSIIRSGTATGSVPVVPADLLVNQVVAVPCLIAAVRALSKKSEFESFDKITQFGVAERSQFLSATGALRTIISSAIAEDDAAAKRQGTASNPEQGKLRSFIELFRKESNIDVGKVLVHALRSSDRLQRSNALLILGNVVDNTVVCVAIDHLYDPKIADTDYGINARANLLAVVSVVAPWAYAETFDNIKDVVAFVKPRVGQTDNLKYTRDILANIEQRLDRQTERTNQSVCLPENERACYSYASSDSLSKRLRYPTRNCGKK